MGLVIGGMDGNDDNSEALRGEGLSELSGYHVERRLLRSAREVVGEALDVLTPSPVLPSLPSPATLPYVEPPEPNSIEGLFFQGYREGGGVYPEERITTMIFCESEWRVDPGGYHLGLAQFDPGTWATVSAITGFTDPFDPYHQGYNVAVWASMVSPGTSAGWPHCWRAW